MLRRRAKSSPTFPTPLPPTAAARPRPPPAHLPRGPEYISRGGRPPAPADSDDEGPAAVMVGGPPPGLVADPHVVSAPPHPPSVPVRSPVAGHDDRGGPDVSVFRNIYPTAVLIEVAGVYPEFIRQVPIASPARKRDPVPPLAPLLTAVGSAGRGRFRVAARSQAHDAAPH